MQNCWKLDWKMRGVVAGFLSGFLIACDRPITPGEAEPTTGKSGPLEEVERILKVDRDPVPEPAPKSPTRSAPEAAAPVAEPVPKKPGFVISPYNGKWIDVGTAKPGELMLDPHFDAAENKLFRVPEIPEAQERKEASAAPDPSL
jgi:hypothetical protein